MSDAKQLAYLVSRCFESTDCIGTFSTPRKLRDHLRDSHGYVFPARLSSTRRYKSETYIYLRHCPDDPNTEFVIGLFACPCCTDHYIDLNGLSDHFRIVHFDYLPPQQQQRIQDDLDVESANVEYLGDDTSQNSMHNSSSTKQKRPREEELSVEGIVFPPPGSDRLVIDSFDLAQAFFDFQTSLKQEKWKLSLEQNVHLALAATSILLITPNKYNEQLQPFFTSEEWGMTNNWIQDLYEIKRQPMPLDTVSNMLRIIDDLINKNIDREEADARLKKLPLDEYGHKFAKAVGGLILKLMRIPMDEDANETELCSRFIDPFLSGLFDDPDQGICLRWTNDATLEAKKCADFTTDRPDLCITKCCGVKWKSSLAYGEAKPAMREKDHFLLCKDLLKVAIFCKDALDSQLMQGVLGIQIIGRTIQFYLLALPAKGLYTMIELALVKIPDSLQNLSSLVIELPNVLKVLDVFHRICIPVNDVESAKSRMESTLPRQKFDQLFTMAKDRKRPCHLKVRHV